MIMRRIICTVFKTLATLFLLLVSLVVALGCTVYEVCEDFVYDVKNLWSESANEEEQ